MDGNYGVAILLLTLLVKLLFYPLANKSYRAMSKMKKLQPEMMRLREQYGDDKVRMNQELMALYKNEKVNPMSGCLPIIVQIPVFFALYKVLFVSIEMRHAPFFGWIHDLSAPDPTTIFNLFGLIPWDPPAFLMIGVWPLLMGATMLLQTKLNPQPADPMQARVMMLLPVDVHLPVRDLPGRAGDLLDLEQRALDRPAVADHEAHGRVGLSRARAGCDAGRAARRRRRGSRPGRRLFAQACQFVAGVADLARLPPTRTCPRSPSPAARTSASRA